MTNYLYRSAILVLLPLSAAAEEAPCELLNPPAPVPGLELSVSKARKKYSVGDAVKIDVTLANISTKGIPLVLEHRRENTPNSTVQVLIWINKVGKWDKPIFHQIAHFKEYYHTLPPGQSLRAKGVEIGQHFDGPGVYRVSATYQGNRSQFFELTIERKDGQEPAGGDGETTPQPHR